MKIANDPKFHLTIRGLKIMPEGKLQFQLKTKGNADLTFGTTAKHLQVIDGKELVTGADMAIDTRRVQQHHHDPTGVTTVGHEFDHAIAIQEGRDPAAGDKPTSATGPSEKMGQQIAAQTPELKQEEAEKLLDTILTERPPP